MPQVAPLAFDKNCSDTSQKLRHQGWYICFEVFGALYILLSVGLSFKALEVFASSTKSDLFIGDFESSVSKIIDTFNHVLASTSKEENFDLLARSSTSMLDLSGVAPAYPRMLMYSKLNSLEFAVNGLRNLSPSQVVKMVSLYCWADLGRQWEMAYSIKRQERCRKSDYENGAVVFEAVLRNIKLSSWIKTTDGKFESCIAGPIKHSGSTGQDWYNKLLSHVWLSVNDEIKVWNTNGITRFTLQYGTGFGIGIEENIIVENALGLRYKLQIKGIPATNRWTYRTTSVFYDLLYNDFYAISQGQSLIRNTTKYFGVIDDTQIEAYDKGLPLAMIDQVVHDRIGPLGNIDAKWLAPPDTLISSVGAFHDLILSRIAVDAAFRSVVNQITATSVSLTPIKWSDFSLRFYGGNPMCGYGSPLPFVQQTFGFDDACGTQQPLTIEWDGFNSLFAYVALNATWNNLLFSQVSKPKLCANMFIANSQAYSLLSLPLDKLFTPTLESHNISILQFVENDTQLNLQHQNLLDSSFALFGWMMLYDWAFNQREALSIQGDTDTFNIISYRYSPLPVAMSVPPASLAPYFFWLGALVTFTLAIVAILAIVLWIKTRPLFTEWVSLWSIVSSIWMSRNLLLLRSIMALVCLSTVHLQVVSSNSVQSLVAPCRSILISCLMSGESLWLVYLLHDCCLPLTHQCLRVIAPWTTAIAWIITVAIDQLTPLQLQANINRQCYAVNMDYMLYCTSGNIKIGSLSRVLIIGAIHVCSVAVSIIYSLFKQDDTTKQPHRPSLIPLHICALLRPKEDGHLNYVALLISGLVPIHILKSSFLFDTKLWRLLNYSQLGGEPGNHPSLNKNKHLSLIIPSLKVIDLHTPRRDLLKLVYFQRRIWVLLGLVYLGFTLVGNIAYLNVLQKSMANDFGWAGFTTSGMHVFLANLFNEQLLTTTSKIVQLESPSFGSLYQQINGTDTTISWFPTIARRQLFQPNTSLEAIIKGLRSMEPRLLPMFTQYCWLDFEQRWEMASTTIRQLRCHKQSDNGAIYLESGLRNVNDWNMWLSAWGDSFELGIANYLKTFTKGQLWLDTVNSSTLSIGNEVLYWKSHFITTFVLQWQNYKITGFSDVMSVSTALNLQFELDLAKFDATKQLSYQVSMRMYWSFASDLWAISTNLTSTGSASLLR
ncbi:hypothetical protein THRCLA_08164 [Thraustotheca clavata]|uniref:Uncharacterized protein n=1 Tax=Thraustotheca clavata TaxID=74557 RepID=A0A1V9Z8Z5_9STRA|nr:hypothetical protein THRCLA_08164 [Thraustotheca clavata]